MEPIKNNKMDSTPSQNQDTMSIFNPLKQFMHDKINERFIEGLRMCHTVATLIDTQQTNQLDIMLGVESIFASSNRTKDSALAAKDAAAAVFVQPQNSSASKGTESRKKNISDMNYKWQHNDLEMKTGEESGFDAHMSVGSIFSFGKVPLEEDEEDEEDEGSHRLGDINEMALSREFNKSVGINAPRPEVLAPLSKPNPGFQPVSATTAFPRPQKPVANTACQSNVRKNGNLSAVPALHSHKGGKSFSVASPPVTASTQILGALPKSIQTNSNKPGAHAKVSITKLNRPIPGSRPVNTGIRPLSNTRPINVTNATGQISGVRPIYNEKFGNTSANSGIISSKRPGGGIGAGSVQKTGPISKHTTSVYPAKTKEDGRFMNTKNTDPKAYKSLKFYKTHSSRAKPTEEELALRHEVDDSFDFNSSSIAPWANPEMIGNEFPLPSSPVNANCLLPLQIGSIFPEKGR